MPLSENLLLFSSSHGLTIQEQEKKSTIRTINNIDSLVFPSLHFTLLGSFLTLGFQREQNFPKAILVVEDNIKQIKKFI